jgi:ferric-dicitrate binding protein FerR (iron transport regulator)
MTRWRRTTACERASQWISLDLDGELGRLEQAALARHLGRCERCRAVSSEFQGFTGLLRDAPAVEPERLVAVPHSRRSRTRTNLRGMAIAVLASAAVFGAFSAVPRSGGHPTSSLSFGDRQQQRAYVREHLQAERTLYEAAQPAAAPPFAGRALL